MLNMNEVFEVLMDIDVNPDEVLFSAAPIYDFETISTLIFEYKVFRIRIWDYLHEIAKKNEISLRMSVYDPRYFMSS